MPSQPLVSIAIPVYNRETMIERAIASALAQTYPNIEVVVCDNCSTDGTFEVVQQIARRDSRVVAHRNAENLGPVRNWIECARRSRGEYAWLLFSDDWIDPQAVACMLPPLIDDPQIGFSVSAVRMHEGDREFVNYRPKRPGKFASLEYLVNAFAWRAESGAVLMPVSPGCALFRRDDLAAFIPEHLPKFRDFDANRYGIGNDVTIYLKACEKYPYFFHQSDPVVHFLSHESSFSVRIGGSSPHFLEQAYSNAFAHFLRDAALPPESKRRLGRELRKTFLKFGILSFVKRAARLVTFSKPASATR